MEQRKNFKDKMKELNLPFASAVYCSRIISQKMITTETYSTEKTGLKVLKKNPTSSFSSTSKELKSHHSYPYNKKMVERTAYQ